LFEHGKVITTSAKAKEARPFAEKMITLGKKGTLAARRLAISALHSRQVVASLFTELAPRYANRPGGYCRIVHLPTHRIGDGGDQVLFQLVEGQVGAGANKKATKAAAAPVETVTTETETAPEQPVFTPEAAL
jgi:large subunit ribosomal protein L17